MRITAETNASRKVEGVMMEDRCMSRKSKRNVLSSDVTPASTNALDVDGTYRETTREAPGLRKTTW